MNDQKTEQDGEEKEKHSECPQSESSQLPLVKGDEDLFFGRIW